MLLNTCLEMAVKKVPDSMHSTNVLALKEFGYGLQKHR